MKSEFVRPRRLEKIELPDDGKIRIFQCIGNRVITQNELEGKSKKDVPVIPLAIETDQMPKGNLCIEIWGWRRSKDLYKAMYRRELRSPVKVSREI